MKKHLPGCSRNGMFSSSQASSVRPSSWTRHLIFKVWLPLHKLQLELPMEKKRVRIFHVLVIVSFIMHTLSFANIQKMGTYWRSYTFSFAFCYWKNMFCIFLVYNKRQLSKNPSNLDPWKLFNQCETVTAVDIFCTLKVVISGFKIILMKIFYALKCIRKVFF